jgi:hypothetical protein
MQFFALHHDPVVFRLVHLTNIIKSQHYTATEYVLDTHNADKLT